MLNQLNIEIGEDRLPGELCTARGPGLVVFVDGSGNHREMRRNRQVAQTLQHRGLATLLFDLLTPHEAEARTDVYDIQLLAGRLLKALDALPEPVSAQPVGLFGAGTGAAAALVAAVQRPAQVRAIVSRGGHPELAGDALDEVRAPTLLIVGEGDPEVLALSRQAYGRLRGVKRIDIVPRATHLFQEAGALETVAERAADWFLEHLQPGG